MVIVSRLKWIYMQCLVGALLQAIRTTWATAMTAKHNEHCGQYQVS